MLLNTNICGWSTFDWKAI